MVQFSFAELLEHRVPLAPGEAVALTLALAGARDAQTGQAHPAAFPNLEQIVLSSTGHVSITGPGTAPPGDDGMHLATVLVRLLRVDDERVGENTHSRIPDKLLVLLTQARRHVDLLPFTSEELRQALVPLSDSREPEVLAAGFWRAARIRARHSDPALIKLIRVLARRRGERRAKGSSSSELLGWLRQAGVAALIVLLAVLAASGLGAFAARRAPVAGSTVDNPLIIDTAALPIVAPPAASLEVAVPSLRDTTRTSGGIRSTKSQRARQKPLSSRAQMAPTPDLPLKKDSAQPGRPLRPEPDHARPQRTVHMVNLPHATWAETR